MRARELLHDLNGPSLRQGVRIKTITETGGEGVNKLGLAFLLFKVKIKMQKTY